MKHLIMLMTTALLFSCQKEEHIVKHAHSMDSNSDLLGKVSVVNEEDPICKMTTHQHLSDTTVYKNEVYGFCSSGCKAEFKKAPEKYVSKKEK